MRISYLGLVVVASLALIAAACGGDADRADSGESVQSFADAGSVVVDGAWLLLSGSVDGSPVSLVGGRDVTMDMNGDRIGGTAACNGPGGSVAVGEDGTFSVAELSWTEMGCEPDVMELEQSFLQSLSGVTSYDLDGDVLTISGSSSTWTFEPRASEPTEGITDATSG